jgi:hypothetical protein
MRCTRFRLSRRCNASYDGRGSWSGARTWRRRPAQLSVNCGLRSECVRCVAIECVRARVSMNHLEADAGESRLQIAGDLLDRLGGDLPTGRVEGVNPRTQSFHCPIGAFARSLLQMRNGAAALGSLISGFPRRKRRSDLPGRSRTAGTLGFGKQQHLALQLSELGDQPLAFSCAGQVTHALMGIGRREISVEKEVDAVKVLGSAHEERASQAERPRRSAYA